MNNMTTLSSKLDQVLNQALDAGIASSISLHVGVHGRSLTLHRGSTAEHYPTNDTSIYDVASLTKILGTAVALAYALVRHKMSLDEKPFECWPEITIASLLAHTSGLVAHVKFFETLGVNKKDFLGNQNLMFEELFKQKPSWKVGEKRVYSDLNFLALGYLLEQRFNKSLFDVFLDAWHNAHLEPLTFVPSFEGSESPLIAPTSHGQSHYVHDHNCYYLGGLAGHAGLFANLLQVVGFGQFFMRCAHDPTSLIEHYVRKFIREHLAFDKPSTRGSIRALSPYAFGHFGYTGTSLWIDPFAHKQQGLLVALLTNRVYKNQQPHGIFWLRERVHSLAARFMGNG